MRGTRICATVTVNGITKAMQGCALMVYPVRVLRRSMAGIDYPVTVNGMAVHTTWRVPMSKAYLAGTRVNGTPVNSGHKNTDIRYPGQWHSLGYGYQWRRVSAMRGIGYPAPRSMA